MNFCIVAAILLMSAQIEVNCIVFITRLRAKSAMVMLYTNMAAAQEQSLEVCEKY